MTNEQKLQKLLQIAVENGWENITDCCDELLPDNITLWNGDGYEKETISLNDLVSNWEEGKISFIESLCHAVYNKLSMDKSIDWNSSINQLGDNQIERIKLNWVLQPTSQRLEWLFETFKHLLNDDSTTI